MNGRMVQLRVGGQVYRVVSSASEEELYRLADVVDNKLTSVMPAGRAPTPQAMLLAAIALAHEAEAERSRADSIAAKAKTALGRILGKLDDALRHSNGDAAELLGGPDSGDGGPPSTPPTPPSNPPPSTPPPSTPPSLTSLTSRGPRV